MFGISNWTGKAAPELVGGEWINSQPATLASLRGKIVLVDFWEYSCINCIRTLPYLREWYQRYHDLGLEIIGVHVPEFEFGKVRANVELALKQHGITWPVVLDNDYKTWNAYSNNVWPRELLINQEGVVVHDQAGEGGYQDTERLIQELIKKQNPSAQLPEYVEYVRETDQPNRACFRTSPEIYAGYARGQLGNSEGYKRRKVIEYAEPAAMEEDVLLVSGKWRSAPEFMQRAGGSASRAGWLGLKYHAKGVYAVITPSSPRQAGFKVWVEQDGEPLARGSAGEDVQVTPEGSYFVVDSARMYRIVNNNEFGVHVLKLYPESDGFEFYTFTFESACQ